MFNIEYKCYKCETEWEEQYPSACDSECGNCGAKNVSPVDYNAIHYKYKSKVAYKKGDILLGKCDKTKYEVIDCFRIGLFNEYKYGLVLEQLDE